MKELTDLEKLFRAKVLAMLLRKKKITRELPEPIPTMLEPKISTHDLSQVEPVDDIPDLDVYVQDPICPD